MKTQSISRRTVLRGVASGVLGPGLVHGKPGEALASVLTPVCLREFAARRGSLALARVAEKRLLFASDSRTVRETRSKPGSTVKPFLLQYLLNRGLLREDESYPCSGGPLPFAGRRLDCSHAPQGAPLDPATALALSCNRCFLHWAERLREDPAPGTGFAEFLRQSGFSDRRVFGRQTLPPSVVNPAAPEEMQLQVLGESSIISTPLTLLHAYCRLLSALFRQNAPSSLHVLREGMHECVRAGTGYEARVRGLDLGGKTGTATSPNRSSLNGWMLSFWPATQPRLVMVVYVENGRGGVEAASITGAAWRAIQPELRR